MIPMQRGRNILMGPPMMARGAANRVALPQGVPQSLAGPGSGGPGMSGPGAQVPPQNPMWGANGQLSPQMIAQIQAQQAQQNMLAAPPAPPPGMLPAGAGGAGMPGLGMQAPPVQPDYMGIPGQAYPGQAAAPLPAAAPPPPPGMLPPGAGGPGMPGPGAIAPGELGMMAAPRTQPMPQPQQMYGGFYGPGQQVMRRIF